MLERLATTATRACFYAFDLTYEQTVERHFSRPEAAEFTATEMFSWYREHTPLPFTGETLFDSSWTAEQAVDRIYEDLMSPTQAD